MTSPKHEKQDGTTSAQGDLMDGRGPFEPFVPVEPQVV